MKPSTPQSTSRAKKNSAISSIPDYYAAVPALIPGERATRHVLIVDDCQSMRRRYSKPLLNYGFDVSECEGPKDLKAAAKVGKLDKIHLFVIDVSLTQGNALRRQTEYGELEGIRLAQWLRRRTKYKGVPIILSSASPFEDIVVSAAKAASALDSVEGYSCIFVNKNDYPPDKLSELVIHYFETGSFYKGLSLLSWLKGLFSDGENAD